MNNYVVNIYYEFPHNIYNPITNTYQNNLNGTIYLPLTYAQTTKLSNIITNNNIGHFSKLFIINTQNVFQNQYENVIKLINKDNYILNNQILPMYYIIQCFEILLL